MTKSDSLLTKLKSQVSCETFPLLTSCGSSGVWSATERMKLFIQRPWSVIISHVTGTDRKMSPVAMEAQEGRHV